MKPPNWSKITKLMGKLPDAELARRAGVSRIAILKRRQALGIPAFSRRPPDLARLCAQIELLTKHLKAARR
jgi:ribosomal protein S15P/S13E